MKTQDNEEIICSSCGKPLKSGSSDCTDCSINLDAVWPPAPLREIDNLEIGRETTQLDRENPGRKNRQIIGGFWLGFVVYFVIWLCCFGWAETTGIKMVGNKTWSFDTWRIVMFSELLYPYVLPIVTSFILSKRYTRFKCGAFLGCLGGMCAAVVILVYVSSISMG